MKEHPSQSPSWREKIARTSLAFSLSFASSAFPQDYERSCEETIVRSSVEEQEAPLLGFTFRSAEASYVGLDPHVALEKSLQLGFDQVRLSMYPNQPTEQMVEEISWQVDLAEKYNTDVILVVGRKSPGYPEEYLPRDAYKESIEKTKAVLETVGGHESVKIIQVSNEPFLHIGKLLPEDPLLLEEMIEMIAPYNKPMLFTHLADPLASEFIPFGKTLSSGDLSGVDVYIETGTGRGSCVQYSSYLRELDNQASNAGKPLIVTELQTLPWPDEITIPTPTGDVSLSLPFQHNLEPSEIRKLYKMVLLNTDAESIHFWEVTRNIALEMNGDPRGMNEIRRIIQKNHETRARLLEERETENGGIISFPATTNHVVFEEK